MCRARSEGGRRCLVHEPEHARARYAADSAEGFSEELDYFVAELERAVSEAAPSPEKMLATVDRSTAEYREQDAAGRLAYLAEGLADLGLEPAPSEAVTHEERLAEVETALDAVTLEWWEQEPQLREHTAWQRAQALAAIMLRHFRPIRRAAGGVLSEAMRSVRAWQQRATRARAARILVREQVSERDAERLAELRNPVKRAKALATLKEWQLRFDEATALAEAEQELRARLTIAEAGRIEGAIPYRSLLDVQREDLLAEQAQLEGELRALKGRKLTPELGEQIERLSIKAAARGREADRLAHAMEAMPDPTELHLQVEDLRRRRIRAVEALDEAAAEKDAALNQGRPPKTLEPVEQVSVQEVTPLTLTPVSGAGEVEVWFVSGCDPVPGGPVWLDHERAREVLGVVPMQRKRVPANSVLTDESGVVVRMAA